MAAIDISVTPAYVGEFSTSSSDWQTVAEIPASQLGANRKYLILVACGVDSDGDADDEADGAVEVRVIHGSTAFDDSVAYLCPAVPAEAPKYYRNYGYLEIFTQPGSAESIALQIKRHAAGDDDHQVYAADVSLLAVDIENLTENTDYFISENDDTGAPVDVTGSASQVLTRTFADLGGGGDLAVYAAFVYSNWQMNNTNSAVQLDLALTDGNSLVATVDPAVVRQTAKHADERLAVLFGSKIVVGDSNDAVFTLNIKEYGSSSTKHDHMVTRAFFLRIYDSAAEVGDQRNWAAFDANAISLPIFHTPRRTGSVADTGGEVTNYFFFAHLTVAEFIQPYEPTGYIFAHVPDGTPDDLDEKLFPSYDHVVGFNVGDEDVTPQVRLGTKIYDDAATYFPCFGRTGGDPLGNMQASGYSWIHIATDTIASFSAASLELPQLEITATATFTAPGMAGDGDVTLPTLGVEGVGAYGNFFNAAETLALPIPTVVGSGDFEVYEFSESLVLELPQFEIENDGSFVAPNYDAAPALDLPQFEISGTFEYELPDCAAFEYHEHGRAPISVNQELRYGLDYPLIAPSEDIRYLIADFFLSYDDPSDYDSTAEEFRGPFSIAWFFGHGCLESDKPDFVQSGAYHAADIIVKDADGRVVFDSMDSDDYRSQDWGDRLKIHEWRTVSAVCRVVVHTKWWDAAGEPMPRNYDIHIVPDSAVLDDRTIVRMPKRLRTITVNGKQLQGTIELHNGYNTEVVNHGSIADPLTIATAVPTTGTSDGGRNGYRVEISAEPGSGLGRYPGCDDLSLYIATINNLPPDAYGNFKLSASQCYWWEQPADRTASKAIMTPATLQLHNDCVPCCSCEDYVQVKLGIDSVFLRWRRIATESQRIRDVHADNIDRWESDSACRLQNQNQRIRLTSNCAGFIGVGYTFCSQLDECAGELEVEFAFIVNSAPGERPPPDGSLPPEDDEEPEEQPTFGPELVENWNFSQADAGWTLRGSYHKLTNPDRYILGEDDPLNSPRQLLVNSTFDGSASSWTLAGNAAYVPGGDYVRVGGGGGGVGKLYQTATTDDGETYRAFVFYTVAEGVTRLRMTDGNAVDAGVIDIPAANPNCEGCGIGLLVESNGGSIKVQVESEIAASNYVHVPEVHLVPWSGSLRQVISGLTPGAAYRLELVIAYNTKPLTVAVLSADGTTELLSKTLSPQTQPPFRTVTEDLQIDAEAITLVISIDPDEFGGSAGIRSVSLRRSLYGSGGIVNPEDGEDDDNEEEDGTTYDLNVKYVPNSARKNDIQSQRMKPYVMTGNFPHLKATWDKLNPMKAARLQFLAYACNAIDGDSITVIATPTFRGETLESVSDTIAITPECPSEQELCSDN